MEGGKGRVFDILGGCSYNWFGLDGRHVLHTCSDLAFILPSSNYCTALNHISEHVGAFGL